VLVRGLFISFGAGLIWPKEARRVAFGYDAATPPGAARSAINQEAF
jgi:hypothetical protein